MSSYEAPIDLTGPSVEYLNALRFLKLGSYAEALHELDAALSQGCDFARELLDVLKAHPRVQQV
jgi:hypothetical protein